MRWIVLLVLILLHYAKSKHTSNDCAEVLDVLWIMV